MAYVLALLAAAAFAFGNVLQQKGTLEAPAPEGDPRFLAQILRQPVWLEGAGLQMTGWVLQAMALDRGSLVVVQSLTTMSLVIALPLGAHFTNQRITRRVTAGAVAMIIGIAFFLAVGSPQGGTKTPPASAWWSAGLVAAAVIAVLYVVGQHRRGASKALLFGSAAGVGFGLQAAVTKVFMPLVGKGLTAMLTSWTVYVLIASALVGFVLQQSALKTGVLAPAMASSNAVTLFTSVLLGITVFGEQISDGSGKLAPALVGLAVALVGIVLLAGAEPPQQSEGMPRVDRLDDAGAGPPVARPEPA